MATYRIVLKPAAERDLRKLPPRIQKQVAGRIDALAENPKPPQSQKLEGIEDLYTLRSGEYRILYQVQQKIVTVLIVRIGHRREVYR